MKKSNVRTKIGFTPSFSPKEEISCTTNSRRRIGFAPSYMADEQIEIPQSNISKKLTALKNKMVKMTEYLISASFMNLSEEAKIATVLDYNILVQTYCKLKFS